MSTFDDDGNPIATTRRSLQALHVQRESLEQEAAAIVSELIDTSQGRPPIGIDTSLVDGEGYPRDDIDVYRARSLRRRLAEIRTDHKVLSEQLSTLLQQLATLQRPDRQAAATSEYAARAQIKPKPKYDPLTGKWVVMNWDGTVAGVPGGEKRSFHNLVESASNTNADRACPQAITTTATALPASPALSTSTSQESWIVPNYSLDQQQQQHQQQRPFARIDSIAGPDSPAAQAGLCVGDLIVVFGSVTVNGSSDTSNWMSAVATAVPQAAAQHDAMTVVVLRQPADVDTSIIEGQNHDNDSNVSMMERITLTLRPRPWSGRGLLGCHIVPYQMDAETLTRTAIAPS